MNEESARLNSIARHPATPDPLAPLEMDVRKEAALAARMLLEASRRVPDVREALMAICGRYGHANIVELADVEPQAVIELWEGVQMLEEDSYDNVMKRSKEAADG